MDVEICVWNDPPYRVTGKLSTGEEVLLYTRETNGIFTLTEEAINDSFYHTFGKSADMLGKNSIPSFLLLRMYEMQYHFADSYNLLITDFMNHCLNFRGKIKETEEEFWFRIYDDRVAAFVVNATTAIASENWSCVRRIILDFIFD